MAHRRFRVEIWFQPEPQLSAVPQWLHHSAQVLLPLPLAEPLRLQEVRAAQLARAAEVHRPQ